MDRNKAISVLAGVSFFAGCALVAALLLDSDVSRDDNSSDAIAVGEERVEMQDIGTASTLNPSVGIESNDQLDTSLNGFPDTERKLAAFLRSNDAAFQEIPFRTFASSETLERDPSRIVDLNSEESKLRATMPSVAFSVADIITGVGSRAADKDRGKNGVFHVNCTVSHFGYDDPIAKWGKPGEAHLHMFFGNTETNAFSTSDTILNKGNGTCQHEELNRTAYWLPAMLDGNDNVLRPDSIVVYYESLANKDNLQNFPEGLNFISGNALATEPQTEVGFRGASFFCGWYNKADHGADATVPSSEGGQSIPDCDPEIYSHLQINLSSPFCWNGELDWSHHNPNVVYPEDMASRTCPASHDIKLPNLWYRYHYDIRNDTTNTGSWYFSSDVDFETGELRGPAGSSLHADWWNGWNQELIDVIYDNCIKGVNVWCENYQLGNGSHTDVVARVFGVEDEKLAPETVLQTCPVRQTYDGNRRNIAYCVN